MPLVTIKNGKVELRKESGSLIRNIGNGNAIDADINNEGNLILITLDNGKVELRKESGSLLRNIGNGHTVGAKFSGKDILLKLSTGKQELRKESGSLIKVLQLCRKVNYNLSLRYLIKNFSVFLITNAAILGNMTNSMTFGMIYKI